MKPDTPAPRNDAIAEGVAALRRAETELTLARQALEARSINDNPEEMKSRVKEREAEVERLRTLTADILSNG